MLAELGHLYPVHLTCDEELTSFHLTCGMIALTGMGLRNPTVLASPSI